MQIIISPAKTMKEDRDSLPVNGLPHFLKETRELLRAVQALSYEEAKELWGCNDKLAQLNCQRFRQMDLEKNLTPAVLAYEGLQYQHMAPRVFTRQALSYLEKHLRILSGFYGVLSPFDGVTPYRLEMQARLSVNGASNLYDFWGKSLYQEVKGEDGVIINLASKEYWMAVAPFLGPEDTWITCTFGQLNKGKVKQKATLAKMARGEMVRFMAENQVEDPEEMKAFSALNFRYAEEFSTKENMVFLAPESVL